MRHIPDHTLWLGHAGDARDKHELLRLGIGAVVDLAVEEPPAVAGHEMVYCRFPLIDGTDNPPWPTDLINSDHFVFGTSSPAAIVGYPIINVPAGMTFGVPVGISFIGTAFSEPTLIKLASGFEAVTQARQKPQFLQTLPFSGPPPFRVRGRGLVPKRNAPLISEL